MDTLLHDTLLHIVVRASGELAAAAGLVLCIDVALLVRRHQRDALVWLAAILCIVSIVSGFLPYGVGVELAVALVILLCLDILPLVKRHRRDYLVWIAAISCAALVVSMSIFLPAGTQVEYQANQDAKAQGFGNADDKLEAKRFGYGNDAQAWRAKQADLAAQKAARKQAIVEAEQRVKMEAARQAQLAAEREAIAVTARQATEAGIADRRTDLSKSTQSLDVTNARITVAIDEPVCQGECPSGHFLLVWISNPSNEIFSKAEITCSLFRKTGHDLIETKTQEIQGPIFPYWVDQMRNGRDDRGNKPNISDRMHVDAVAFVKFTTPFLPDIPYAPDIVPECSVKGEGGVAAPVRGKRTIGEGPRLPFPELTSGWAEGCRNPANTARWSEVITGRLWEAEVQDGTRVLRRQTTYYDVLNGMNSFIRSTAIRDCGRFQRGAIATIDATKRWYGIDMLCVNAGDTCYWIPESEFVPASPNESPKP